MTMDATAAVSMNMSIVLNQKTGHPSARPASTTVSANVRYKHIASYFREALWKREPLLLSFSLSVHSVTNLK